jgi:hypothetical protein
MTKMPTRPMPGDIFLHLLLILHHTSVNHFQHTFQHQGWRGKVKDHESKKMTHLSRESMIQKGAINWSRLGDSNGHLFTGTPGCTKNISLLKEVDPRIVKSPPPSRVTSTHHLSRIELLRTTYNRCSFLTGK